MCVFRFGIEVLMSTLTLKQSVSKVIRTEVETCFLNMKINFSMLLLLLMTFNNLGKGTKKKTDYLVTLIKRVGRYLAEITIS